MSMAEHVKSIVRSIDLTSAIYIGFVCSFHVKGVTTLPIHWSYHALIMPTLLFFVSEQQFYGSFKPFEETGQLKLFSD